MITFDDILPFVVLTLCILGIYWFINWKSDETIKKVNDLDNLESYQVFNTCYLINDKYYCKDFK